ncbi:oxygen-independent coproporphyrinogen III oxidase [Fodinicurvata fenggangensis]|uniref:oxygen-independent coproporphyrinogen III oxidase n=1 Tax=Fodinicurvata fenggangensis TaxID=1121830 RepID=UPI00047B515B|nr:oxygen-independent coproporphyrinogen III oxidase [Fodinicurvata fenggangensis]
MDKDIAACYMNARLPRYTSYPTAPHFSDVVSQETYANWLSSLSYSQTASLYLHIPFCRSMCWYCGCHTTITRQDTKIIDYLSVLREEIELVAKQLSRPLSVNHLHFGGGTPTIISPDEFRALMDLLRRRFLFTDDAEVAVEIDPRRLTGKMIDTLGATGVTRASLGVQTLDPLVQKAINRIQGYEQVAAVTDGLRAAGVAGVNFDLIYGLPNQTPESCIATVKQCLELLPGRFAVFGYAHVPDFKKHQRKIDESALADAEGRLAQADAIKRTLLGAGYEEIGIDHFALPDDPMAQAQRQGALHRNFQGYTTDVSDVLIGLGASAIGRLEQGYVQNNVVLGRYAARVSQGQFATTKGLELTNEDRLRAEIIERLMCDFRVDLGTVCNRFGEDPASILQDTPQLQALAADGLIQIDGDVVSLAEDNRFLVRNVASAFDSYLEASGRTFSRAV